MSSLFTIDSNDFAGTQWQVSDGPDTDFADNMSAGYDRFSRAMSITMIQENYVAELSPIIDKVKDATGERQMNPGGELQFMQDTDKKGKAKTRAAQAVGIGMRKS